MILVDISQVILSNLLISVNTFPEINEDNIRYMVLNSIGSYNRKFKSEYGQIVICCDSKPSWRKNLYRYYKANRAKSIKESQLDWNKIFEIMNNILKELDEYFPYRVVKADYAEGDDVIATLVMENSIEIINNNNKILIVSADLDFSQLQKYPNVEQYDPVFKKAKIKQNRPYEFLREHIIRGDAGDGIPNILSNDDTFILGERQKSIFSKKISSWLVDDPRHFCDDNMLRNFKRNEELIDFNFIPSYIKSSILECYKSQAGKDNKKILPYFIKYQLSKLMKNIQDY